MKKKIAAVLLASVLAAALAGCGGSSSPSAGSSGAAANTESSAAASAQESTETAQASGPKELRTAASFAYASLDVHKEYYGWYTSIYGVSEALFRMNENSEVIPCLAESAEVDESGLVWTVKIKKEAAFANGTDLTADMVKRNLERVAEVNSRFAYLADFTAEVVDDKTLTITTPEIYPTMKNDLASPELGMVDLDATTDFDLDPVCTGPFLISSFVPGGDVTVVRNDNYWGGDVKLDSAVFYYMQEDDPKLMAMQSGEIDCYNSVSSAALEIYNADPDTYNVVSIPGARLQFYIVNENRLDAAVREAITLTIDKDAIAQYLAGTVSPAVGPFSTNTPYGQVTVPAVDTAKAKQLLEDDGYVMGDDGFYAKDGEKLTLNIAYYAARSLDTLAVLMKDQLKAVGIDSTLTVEEDPDSTYIATGDFDLGLYCMIADKAGDPLYFIDSTLSEGSYYNVGGFHSDECQALIEELRYETDTERRAELANQIIQIAIDDNAFGYVGLFNNTTVLRKGVSGFAEDIPFDFYGIDANTDKQ